MRAREFLGVLRGFLRGCVAQGGCGGARFRFGFGMRRRHRG